MQAELRCQGHFVILAVAIQDSSVAECFETVHPFIHRSGHLLAHLLEPVGIDFKGAGGKH